MPSRPLMLRLLGGFRLSGPDGEIVISAAKQRALIAVLAVEAPHPLQRDWLLELLWGGRAETQARQSLRQAVSKLRRTIGGDAILSDGTEIGLAAGALETDLVALSRVRPGAALKELAFAAGAWQGEMLEGQRIAEPGFQDWLETQRRRFRELAVEAIHAHAEALLAIGTTEAALAEARRAFALEPLRDDLCGAVMRALAAAGRRADALKTFEGFSKTLSQELGVAPDGETTALAEHIRQGTKVEGETPAPPAPAKTDKQGPNIALPPLVPLTSDAEIAMAAAAFSDDLRTLIAGLGGIEIVSLGHAAADGGPHFLLEGSARPRQGTVRLNFQLIRDGVAVWSAGHNVKSGDFIDGAPEIVEKVAAAVTGLAGAGSVQGLAVPKREGRSEPPGPPRLAILPFRSLEGDAELDRIGERLSRIAIIELSANPVLQVIDAPSSMAVELAGRNAAEAAGILGADIVADGKLWRVDGGTARLAVALHWAGADAPFWTERLDLAPESAAPLGTDLLQKVCAAIGLHVEDALIASSRARPTDNAGALDHFLRGLEHHHRHERIDLTPGREAFAAALAADPGFGRAAAGLAISYIREWFWDSGRDDLIAAARSHAERAVRLSPRDAWAQTALAVTSLYQRSFAEAERAIARARELAPYDAYVISRVGLVQLYAGRPEEAAEVMEIAIALDPIHADRQFGFLGHALFLAGRAAEAAAVLRRIEAPLIWELAWLTAALYEAGDAEGAAGVAARILGEFSPEGRRYDVRTRPYRRQADLERIRTALEKTGLAEALMTESDGDSPAG